MIKLPKIVRSRLAQKMAETSAAHPDPNLLAAFAENSLLARERASVIVHLAECADCRESLALAFAAREPGLSPVTAQLASSSFGARLSGAWLRRWRWVAMAAVACGVLAVALQYRLVSPVFETGRPQVIVALPEKSGSLPSPASSTPGSSTPSGLMTYSVPLATKLARRSIKPVPQSIKAIDERLPAENPVAVQPYIASQAEDSSAKPVPHPGVETATPYQDDAALHQNAPAAEEHASPVDAGFMPSRALASSSKNGLMDAEKLKGEARQTVVARRALAKVSEAPNVLWSINASPETAGNPYGVVQRSADRGKTWETVALNERVNFRAVAASGDYVWAGGSGGVLFHSPDGGSLWVEITVAGENSRLTGAIVSIDARDPAQLKITTSSRERWISTDHGRHWMRE
ncbi:MAG: hypothetical protein DMG57_10145 [Acidobacteria bacterium]|nr:MAG: hypothetical protein DMG57_10145 [Acidobacteriota bacterium]